MSVKIPTSWSIKKIGEIGEVIGGGTPSTKEESYYGGKIPWITPKDLSNHKFVFISRGERNISKLGLKKSSAKLMPEGTVLFSSRAPIGYVAIAKNEISTNQGFKSVICNEKIVNNKFVYYSLKNYKEAIEGVASGSTFKEVSGKVLKNFKIPVPPLDEQNIIAEILFSLDSKIELNQCMNQTLEGIGRAIFKHWFMDFEFPDEQGRPYKSSGGEMVDSELGEIPKGWEVASFSDAVELNPSMKVNKELEKIYVPMSGVSKNSMVITEFEVRKGNSGSKFRNADTLFARITPSTEHGKTAFVQFLNSDEEIALGSTEFIVMRSKTLNPYYVYCIARDEDFRQYAIHNMTGTSGRQRVPTDCFENYFIPQPDSKTLSRFTDVLSTIFSEINVLHESNQNLSKIRDSLLPKLMSGKIRLLE